MVPVDVLKEQLRALAGQAEGYERIEHARRHRDQLRGHEEGPIGRGIPPRWRGLRGKQGPIHAEDTPGETRAERSIVRGAPHEHIAPWKVEVGLSV
jgi:hypothetical protein